MHFYKKSYGHYSHKTWAHYSYQIYFLLFNILTIKKENVWILLDGVSIIAQNQSWIDPAIVNILRIRQSWYNFTTNQKKSYSGCIIRHLWGYSVSSKILLSNCMTIIFTITKWLWILAEQQITPGISAPTYLYSQMLSLSDFWLFPNVIGKIKNVKGVYSDPEGGHFRLFCKGAWE